MQVPFFFSSFSLRGIGKWLFVLFEFKIVFFCAYLLFCACWCVFFVLVFSRVFWALGRCLGNSLQAIQSSLSSSSLANNPSNYQTETSGQTINKKEVGMIVQLKRELEEKEKFTQR